MAATTAQQAAGCEQDQNASSWEPQLKDVAAAIGVAASLLATLGYLSLRAHLNAIGGAMMMVPLSPARYLMEIAEFFAAVLSASIGFAMMLAPVLLLSGITLMSEPLRRAAARALSLLSDRLTAFLYKKRDTAVPDIGLFLVNCCVLFVPFILIGERPTILGDLRSEPPIQAGSGWQFSCFLYSFMLCAGAYAWIRALRARRVGGRARAQCYFGV
jgi:hypothetical protein